MTLVAFAGKDPEEQPIHVSEPKYLRRKSSTRPERAYRMFREGADTFDIAKRLEVHERAVHRMITMERCRQRFLPSPYGVK